MPYRKVTTTRNPGRDQIPGNRRYQCPACGQPAIQPITMWVESHMCPVAKRMVTVEEVRSAPTLPEDNE